MAQLGYYRIGRTLGGGTFGRVACTFHTVADHELTQQRVAIKILNRAQIHSGRMTRKVKREINILKLFHHPHIIRLYEVIETPNNICLVMEYVPGGDLYSLIEQRGRLVEPEAQQLFQQTLSAVDYCHKNQVTHRDLKPENILLDEHGRVKLGDFGLANLMRDGEFFKTSCGSPNYAAPEVISGKAYSGAEVDVWSCGVVLYALLAGALPFDEARLPALYEKIKTGQYHMPYHFSDPVKDLISRMLTLDPIARITVSEVLKHPWVTAGMPNGVFSTLMVNSQAHCLAELRAYHAKRIIDLEVFQLCKNLPAIMGHEDLTVEKLANRKAGALGVCYDILYDTKQKLLAQSHHFQVPSLPFTFTSPPYEPPLPTMEVDQLLVKPSNWVYDFSCQLDAVTLMTIIYEGFKTFALEWKIITNFRSVVRTLGYKQHLQELGERPLTPVAYGTHLKFSLCIYRFESAFVLDLALTHGQALHFLDLCALMYRFLTLKPQICS